MANQYFSMDSNTQKEEFSYAYIYAIAATAGYAIQKANTPLDQIGIDLTIAAVGQQGIFGMPQIFIQVKSTSRELISPNQYPPLILVVVLVPDEVEQWLEQSEDELCLKYSGYWLSLQGRLSSTNEQSVTVQIPRQNLFTVQALKSIMERLSQGEAL
jgi:hypothetical protein